MFIPVRVRQAPLSFPLLFPTSLFSDPPRLFQHSSSLLISCSVGFNGQNAIPSCLPTRMQLANTVRWRKRTPPCRHDHSKTRNGELNTSHSLSSIEMKYLPSCKIGPKTCNSFQSISIYIVRGLFHPDEM